MSLFQIGDKGLTRDGRQYEVTEIHSSAKLFNAKVDDATYVYYPNGKLHANGQTGIDLMLPDDAEIDLLGHGDQIFSMRQMRRCFWTDDLIRTTYPNAKRMAYRIPGAVEYTIPKDAFKPLTYTFDLSKFEATIKDGKLIVTPR